MQKEEEKGNGHVSPGDLAEVWPDVSPARPLTTDFVFLRPGPYWLSEGFAQLTRGTLVFVLRTDSSSVIVTAMAQVVSGQGVGWVTQRYLRIAKREKR